MINWMSGKFLKFCVLAALLFAAVAAPAYSAPEPGGAFMAHGCHGGGHHYYDYHRGPGYCG